MNSEVQTNIETIQKQIQEETFITETQLYDGISIECKIPEGKTLKQCQTALNKFAKTNKLLPISVEPNKEILEYFILQFPELIPYYNEEQKYNMFYNSIDYLIDNNIKLSKNTGVIVTKQMIVSTRDRYTLEAIKIYYNWNVNKYRLTIKELINDKPLRDWLDVIFNTVVTKYFNN